MRITKIIKTTKANKTNKLINNSITKPTAK